MNSLLDTDYYTLTVGDACFQNFPTLRVEYRFKCRNANVRFDESFSIKFARKLRDSEGVKFYADEIRFLEEQKVFSRGYLDFLRDFSFRPSAYVEWRVEDGELKIRIEGVIASAIMYEVPLLSMINECFFDAAGSTNFEVGRRILNEKIDLINRYNVSFDTQVTGYPHFVEFGTRRRRSLSWQGEVVETLYNKLPYNMIGTSNVLLAKNFGFKVIGTQSHQWYQLFQATGALKDSLKNAMDVWLLTHRGRLATALTDIVGSKRFFRAMDPLHYKAFDGFRGDSGDNRWWLNLLKESLLANGVAPMLKTAYLSNALDVPEALRIHADWKGVFRDLVFAIGTKFTNHFDVDALNIVIKLWKVAGQPVAKISDDAGKIMGPDGNFVALLQNTFS